MQIYAPPIGFDSIREAKLAEEVGFDGIRVSDHFFTERGRRPHPFVVLGAAAVTTSRVRLTQTVACANFRHPAEVANAIASVHRVSGGRAELGLGAGWYEEEHSAFDIPFGSPSQRIERLCEAAAICREMLANDGLVRFVGNHFKAVCSLPWPALPSVPDVLVAVGAPRSAQAAAKVADRLDFAIGSIHQGAELKTVSHVANLIDIAMTAGQGVHNRLKFSVTITVAKIENGDAPEHESLSVAGTNKPLLHTVDEVAQLGVDRIHLALPAEGGKATMESIIQTLPRLRRDAASPSRN